VGGPVLNCRADEHEIKNHAIWATSRVRTLLHSFGRSRNFCSSEELTTELNSIAIACQARPIASNVSMPGLIARMRDPLWWTKTVRQGLLRENEVEEHANGAIHKHKQCYVSDHASKVKKARRKANASTLDRLEIVSEDGEVFNLGEVAAGSVSNPAIRRAELMMRCKGFEDVAQVFEHTTRFITITCPSRFHKFTGAIKRQDPNPKWDGSNPRDAQKYLSKVWARMRAAWARKGYRPYGFRIAEPHHDGCPHWHILLLMPKVEAGWFSPMRYLSGRKDCGTGVVGIAGAHAMRDSPTEVHYKTRTARFDCKVIDANSGSATGYIAKYICKNVDGLHEGGSAMGEDLESAKPATESSKRVRDWASTWGIRQFQQIGGPSVTVWRELRRMREVCTGPVNEAFDFEGPRKAADESNWAQFWVLQGGPWTPRKELTLGTFTMESDGGKYGDTVKRIKGVLGKRADGNEILFKTRIHEWTVQRAGLAATNAAYIEQLEFMDVVAEMRDIESRFGMPLTSEVRFPVFENFGRSPPRTSVNNCTKPADDPQIPATEMTRSGPHQLFRQ
jgi:hypothetical protein